MIFINGFRVRVGNEFVNNAKINYNPLNLPDYTLRLKFKSGSEPSAFYEGTWNLVSEENNIWDFTYPNNNWNALFLSNSNLTDVIGANTTNVTSMGSTFCGSTSLSSVSIFDTSNVVYMDGLFQNCQKLSSVPEYNTKGISSMRQMFEYCYSLTSIPMFDTSNVKDMGMAFEMCYNLTNIPKLDTSNVTSISWTWNLCSKLREIPDLNLSNVIDAGRAFDRCSNVSAGIYSTYNKLSSVSSHYRTFYNCGVSSQTGSAELAQIPNDWK